MKDLPLWANAQDHEPEIRQLARIARELAEKAGEFGVTIADVRITAAQRNLLVSRGHGRQLSYLGAVMKKAGLKATDRIRRSHVEGTHGNRNTVWVLPDEQESAA